MACLDDSSLPFLHGTLVIRVEEAKDLPDKDSSWWFSDKNVTDAFVKVDLLPVSVKVAETKVNDAAKGRICIFSNKNVEGCK